jgi:hypothetical protein
MNQLLLRQACKLALSSAVVLAPLHTHAFEAPGHQAIEQAAYRLLLQRPAGDGLPDGHTIARALARTHILKDDLTTLPITALPTYTTYPDLSFERQFAQDRQVYHFMAPNQAVVRAATLKINGQPAPAGRKQRELLVQALPNCFAMMYFFYLETVKNSLGASQAGRGAYVLMHVVADSYSAEHATRVVPTYHLTAVKGWRLSRFGWPAAAKDTTGRACTGHTLAMLHRVTQAKADKCWADPTNPSRLKPNAEEAAVALSELLVTLYKAQLVQQSVLSSAMQNTQLDELWRKYTARFFSPEGSEQTSTAFVYAAVGNDGRQVIPFSFRQRYDYQPHAPERGETKQDVQQRTLNSFTFDRFPMNTWYIAYQYGYSQDKSAWGVELNHHWTPAGADERGVLFRRIPWGYALTATLQPAYARRTHDNVGHSLQLGRSIQLEGLFAPNIVVLPMLNATLQGRVGVGVLPLAPEQKWATISGASLAWNIGHDFGRHYVYSWRVALGYDYDTAGLPAFHNVNLKLGFNSWRGRVTRDALHKYHSD